MSRRARGQRAYPAAAERRKRGALRAAGLWIAASLIILGLAILVGLPRTRRASERQPERAPAGALEPAPDPHPSGNATETGKP